MSVYICKRSSKGDCDGLAFGQDAFLHSCYVDIFSWALMNCYLLEVLAGLVSTSTLILILSPLKGCSLVDEASGV